MKLRLVSLALLLLSAAPVSAADAVVLVVFDVHDTEWSDQPLMQAILEALSRTPSFNLMAKPSPDALVITVPGGFGHKGHETDQTTYSYTVVFFRNGDKIGESLEGCSAKTVLDCADQLASDAQSAAGVMK